ILYLGDHDPSGIDMTRDVEDRLQLFSRYHYNLPIGCEPGSAAWDKALSTMNTRKFDRYKASDFGGQEFNVVRVALNMDQVEAYNLPPNPARLTDARSKDYIEKFGHESWELDALEPSVLADLVRTHVEDLVDHSLMDAAKARQKEARGVLEKIAQDMKQEREV